MVLYEMASGRKAEEFPAPPRDLAAFSVEERGDFHELNGIILKACAQDPGARYASAREMGADLELLRKGESVLRLRELEEREALRKRRKRLGLIAGGAAAVLGIFVGLAVYTWSSNRRALEQNHRRELRELEISWMRLRSDGWVSNYWAKLTSLAGLTKDPDLLTVAASLLTGVDAHPEQLMRWTEATSACFSEDGRLIVEGATEGAAFLMETNAGLAPLRVGGLGPVAWRTGGEPVQLRSADDRLELRNATNGVVIQTFDFSRKRGPLLALSHDGQLAGASADGELVLWNADSGARIGQIKVAATAIGFSPDNSLVGAGTREGLTRIYSTADLREIATLQPSLRGNPILALAFGRDPIVPYEAEREGPSWLVAVGDQGAEIVVWDLAKRMPRSFCRGSTWLVSALAFSPDGMTLASAGRNQPRLWDVASGRPLLQLTETSSGNSLALAFDRTGRKILTGGLADGSQATLALWRIESDRGIRPFRGLTAPVRKVWLSDDAEQVAALSDDWHLGVWDVSANRLRFIFETPVGSLADSAGGAFDRGAGAFVFATAHEARRYNLQTGRTEARWPLPEGFADQVQFNAEGHPILLRCERAAESEPARWRLYDLSRSERAELLFGQQVKDVSAEGAALLPGAKMFFVWFDIGQGRSIRAYDPQTGEEIWRAQSPYSLSAFRLHADPVGEFFGYTAVRAIDGWGLRLLALPQFRETGQTSDRYEAISPGCREFAAERNHLYLLDRFGGHRVALATEWNSTPETANFSRDCKRLAWGTEPGVVNVADLDEVKRRMREFQ